MKKDIQDKIVLLNDEGLTAGKIAQKLKVKKAVVLDVLGTNVNDGLGSTIEAITEATGIKAVVDKVSKAVNKDCGCAARAQKLNEVFPYRKMSDLSNEDFSWLNAWFTETKNSVTTEEQRHLVMIYNNVFNAKRVTSTCSPCVASMVRDLKKVYEAAANKQ
jgi:hypothetical protein